MLPAKGPRTHPFYALEDAFLNVSFTDPDRKSRRIGVRHKVSGDGPPIVLVEDTSHFLQVDAPERTVSEITSFDPVEAVDVTA